MIYFDLKQEGWVDSSDEKFWIPIEKIEDTGHYLSSSEKSLQFENQDQFYLWFYENF